VPTTNEDNACNPDYATSPSEILLEIMGERGMDFDDLARKSCISKDRLLAILARCRMSAKDAAGLELATGVRSIVWLNLDEAYQNKVFNEFVMGFDDEEVFTVEKV
jgi:HTH-type transcriptional regulator / antitoxin HigA